MERERIKRLFDEAFSSAEELNFDKEKFKRVMKKLGMKEVAPGHWVGEEFK